MGLFSFLTGKKDGATAVETPPVTPAPSEPAATIPPAPQNPLFTPPEAWGEGLNTGALTAPSTTASTDPPQVGPTDPAITAELQPRIVEQLKTVFDPEIPVDIYELGLIYDIAADAERRVMIKMTLTSPACPSAQQIPSEVRYKVKAVPGVSNAWVEIVWEPPWDKERMSEEAKLSLGFL